EMVWGPHYMVADIARHITLLPGDVILTGTPCHSRSLDVGDTVEVEISGLGRLSSRVVAGPVPRATALGVGHGLTGGPAGPRLPPAGGAIEIASELGAQDLVVIAVKGPALAAVAPAIGPLLGPQTIVLPAMNGVPWWFEPLQSVDPGGVIAQAIPLQHVIGCVVHASTSTPEPGLVQHRM